MSPASCCVLRYQARGKRGTDWYYAEITAKAGGLNSILVGVLRPCRGSGTANVEEVVLGKVRA